MQGAGSTVFSSVTLLLGLVAGGLALWAAFAHNPQGQYYDPASGGIQWLDASLVFFSWFALVAAPPFIVRWIAVRVMGPS
jgi:hypothetical protein